MRTAFIEALADEARRDPRVVLITGDLGFGVFHGFMDELGAQFVNAGVAEQNMTGMAAGMALAGKCVFTYSIANFPVLRTLEQIRNDVCYHDADVRIVAVGGGMCYGSLGPSHHATEDLAVMRAMPGMTVAAPSDPWQAGELTRQLHERGMPAYLRIDKSSAGLPPEPVALGKVRMVRKGDDGAIFAIGGILAEAVAAADALAADGRHFSVVEVHTLKPLDVAGICAAAHSKNAIVTLEEHVVTGGLGSAVAEALLEGGMAPGAFRRLGLPDEFPAIVGDQPYLRAAYGLDRVSVAKTVSEMLS
jgi:transketolase